MGAFGQDHPGCSGDNDALGSIRVRRQPGTNAAGLVVTRGCEALGIKCAITPLAPSPRRAARRIRAQPTDVMLMAERYRLRPGTVVAHHRYDPDEDQKNRHATCRRDVHEDWLPGQIRHQMLRKPVPALSIRINDQADEDEPVRSTFDKLWPVACLRQSMWRRTPQCRGCPQ
jgi:hypothetical protein